MPTLCSKCSRRIWSKEEKERGSCSSCEVASWSPEKREAMRKLIGLAFRKVPPTDAEKDAAIDEAFKHVRAEESGE